MNTLTHETKLYYLVDLGCFEQVIDHQSLYQSPPLDTGFQIILLLNYSRYTQVLATRYLKIIFIHNYKKIFEKHQ